jgi:hypothetical protein
MKTGRVLRRFVLGCILAGACALWRSDARAAGVATEQHANVDRVVLRYYAPETGGAARPRFITERMLAFETRLEAMSEDNRNVASNYPERYVRAAVARHVTEEILAALLVERDTDPPDLVALTQDARAAWIDRVGGLNAFDQAMVAESIDDSEVTTMLRRQMRAAYYIDRTFTRFLHPSEDELREVFRTSLHPYRNLAFDEAEKPLARWLLQEKLRVAEAAYLQSATTRIKMVFLNDDASTPQPRG